MYGVILALAYPSSVPPSERNNVTQAVAYKWSFLIIDFEL
jgi:hypothetical protein